MVFQLVCPTEYYKDWRPELELGAPSCASVPAARIGILPAGQWGTCRERNEGDLLCCPETASPPLFTADYEVDITAGGAGEGDGRGGGGGREGEVKGEGRGGEGWSGDSEGSGGRGGGRKKGWGGGVAGRGVGRGGQSGRQVKKGRARAGKEGGQRSAGEGGGEMNGDGEGEIVEGERRWKWDEG